MARILDPSEVDFRRSRGDTSWFEKDWLNGEAWLLVSGEDFKSKPETARARLYNEATFVGKASRAKVLGNGDIIFQTYDRTPEEQAQVDATMAKRAATRAANAASGKTPKKKAAATPA